ncbi:hypothetical protein LZ30DRAFT_599320 [Colletotrichum cereale]|nr:hypothetical protein LZ30DRAFT_599320 [Colletotrichum cereale]
MASLFRQAVSGLYTVLAVSILGAWSLIVLAGVGITAVDANPGLLQLIALPSLLTFLVAKLVVAARQTPGPGARPPGSGNLATWLATADHGSPHGALVLLLFSVTWLLYLARVVFALFLLVLMGGFMVSFAMLDAAGGDVSDDGAAGEGRGLFFGDDDDGDIKGGARQNLTTALARFEEQTGVGFGDYLKGNPWLVFQVFAALWAASGLLTAYVTTHAFGAARKVLTTPLEAWVQGGEGPRATGAPAVVVVEQERVVVPAGALAEN